MKFFKSAWHNIRRSPYQAVAAFFIMTLTFLTFSLFAIILYTSSEVVNFFESKPQVTAFFKDQAKQEDIKTLEDSLKASGIVSDVVFISKEEALSIYKQQNKDDPLLLDLVTADILPASLEISTFEIEDLSIVSDTLRKSTIVQEVVFQKDVVSTLTSWTTALRTIGIFSVVVLSIVSIFIMMTIVGIKISHKREDIETMRLIGAGSWYIRWPFLIEGMIYGLIGALFGWLIAIALLFATTPKLADFLHGIPVFPLSPMFLLGLLGLQVCLAILLGAFSSYLAVLRYLK